MCFDMYTLLYLLIRLLLATLGLLWPHRGFLQLWTAGANFQLRCTGFSSQRFLLLQSAGAGVSGLPQLPHRSSSVAALGPRRLQATVAATCRLSSCGVRAQLLRSMWNLHKCSCTWLLPPSHQIRMLKYSPLI